MSGFQTAITIKAAIDNISRRQYLLPAIQRKFVWKSEQIEMLFDSIMRGFPVNSFMFWQISDPELKASYKFYEFLKDYREWYKEENEDINTTAVPDFYAVIDGQQRLTSLYIGLRGSYAYKLKGKWWKDTEDCLPTRHLYLNIGTPVKKEIENQKTFDFRFLTDYEFEDLKNADTNAFWFKAENILDLADAKSLNRWLRANKLEDNDYACDTLSTFCEVIHTKPLINYYLQEGPADDVLEIFIRTNSGGTPLSFSDLLMSMTTANWKSIDARKEISDIVHQVTEYGRPSFQINKDFVLKTCLYLFVDDIKFKVKNFKIDNIRIFEENWINVKESIIACFKLLQQLGFNNTNFRAKNAAIPLIYYIYYRNLANEITKSSYNKTNKKSITNWLILSFLKSIFGGQSDTVLERIRKVLKESADENFPVSDIVSIFKTNGVKDYSLNDEFLDGLLLSEKDSSEAFYVLHLLYPNLDYYCNELDIHQDHLHPQKNFRNAKVMLDAGIPEQDIEYAQKHWNTVANLQLLEGGMNTSKKDTPLIEWAAEKGISKSKLFVNDDTSLEIKDFRQFIETRKQVIKEYLRELINRDLLASE